jgi:hypothetical protein
MGQKGLASEGDSFAARYPEAKKHPQGVPLGEVGILKVCDAADGFIEVGGFAEVTNEFEVSSEKPGSHWVQ